jgi:Tfp pilus assembly protein PilO
VTLLKLSSRAQAFGAGVLDSRGYRYTLEDDKTLTGVKKIYAELSVGGSYANIRAFLRDFENSQRMYTISNVKWSRTDSATELGVVLARYVLMNVPLVEEAAEQTKEG